jgi:signal transduction histidine kinase
MQIDRALLAASWRTWISSDNAHRAGPWWLQWLWTLLFCLALAVPFTVLGFVAFARGNGAWGSVAGWSYWYAMNLIVCLSIGVVIHLLFDIGRHTVARPERVRHWRPWQRTLFFSLTPMLGLAIGWPLGVRLAGQDVSVWIGSREGNSIIGGSIGMAALITFAFHHFFAAKTRQIEAEKRATEAQLRLLQGQIEPHFLFNTLANVLALIDHDTPRARQMLQAFTEYLRSSLATMRTGDGTLAQELDLSENYLRLLATRMEDRLRFSIEADALARSQPLPPLLLQPLVENAVHHGLEPTIDGGQVTIRARVQGGRLVLEVQDDGRGIDAPPRHPARAGAGLALANIRQRLLARYGSAASLDLTAAHPGTLARITLPIQV